MTENEHLDFGDGFNGISRFTCYKPTYLVEEWENGEIIREWDIMREKEDYFAFLVHMNELNKENEELKQFKEKVFNLLDEKIKRYEHKPVSAPVGNPVSVKFDHDVDRLARLSELQQLKKELEE